MACECGCGYRSDGDDVAEFLVQEALMHGLDLTERAERQQAEVQAANEAAIADTVKNLHDQLAGRA